MVYVVDRVVICDAYREPDRHYQLLPGERSKLVEGRRPSMRFLASAKDVKGGIVGVVGKEAGLFEDMSASAPELNEFVNQLREEICHWREDPAHIKWSKILQRISKAGRASRRSWIFRPRPSQEISCPSVSCACWMGLTRS